MDTVEAPRLLALPQVMDLTSLSEPTIRRMVDRGEFPRPVRISSNRKAWPQPSVAAWINSRVEAV
ncbi:helix-turn-helix transcriptional regulator [Phenylobacterium sp.]|uniref:helix-turn-helix transcriptional regulator n=1 Tax=Phenylobacterium sp. TaxID=1871053 RepID=UPI003BAC6599